MKETITLTLDPELVDALKLLCAARGHKLSTYINHIMTQVVKAEVEDLIAKSRDTVTVSRHAMTEADCEAANQIMRMIGAKPRYKSE